MEDDILDSLEDLRYQGVLTNNEEFQKAIEGGSKSVEYTQLVEWLSKELKVLCKLDDHVNAISTPDDSSSFLMEVSSFLKEMQCPYKCLTEGALSQRLLNKQSRCQLLDFLCTELQAARMIAHNNPESNSMKVEVQESPTAASLKNMLIALQFPKPPANITPNQLFSKIETKVKDILPKIPPQVLSKPLFTGQLSDKQWHTLELINEDLKKEYQLRRSMIIKRLDVTIQSFRWSSRAKNREDDVARIYTPIRQTMLSSVNVGVADILAARETVAIMEKTSCASVRKNTQSAINKVMIGKVPDRGGRPNEQRPPPPEMPSWQKRSDAPSGGTQKQSRKINLRDGHRPRKKLLRRSQTKN